MKLLPGFSDSIAAVVQEPPRCPTCGVALRVAHGVCLRCLLEEGLSTDALGSEEQFEAVLAEADVPDREWRLGNYDILGEIGRGGMGIIYRARQRRSRRMVAVKRVLSHHADSHDSLHRFRREADAAASLDHPNILPIYEVAETPEGLPFFSMKWATGGNLREVGATLRENPRECVRLMAKVARAVAYAHSAGILHRDLQPANILLDARGEPMVSDFGLAKWIDENSAITRTLTTFGTPGYIAPEQAEGPAANVTAAADIYSLGAILFSLLAGRPPFVGTNALAVIRQAAERPAPALRSISPALDRDLETIVARCLEREPSARYSSAAALAVDLERWLEGRPILARPVSAPEHAWRWVRRNRVLAAAAAACLLLSVALAAVLLPRAMVALDPPPEKSIAVLPFENLDGDEDDGGFTVGIQQDLLTNLGKVADLKVISRSSVKEFTPREPRNLQQIAASLGVRHILEGRVRRTPGRVQISIQLIDARTGEQLWADSYDRSLEDLFTVESEIAQQITNRLQARLTSGEVARIRAIPTSDMLAYELYLQARDVSDRAGMSTPDRIYQQVRLLEHAVSRDPEFVPALCMLARTHVLAYWLGFDHKPERIDRARKLIETAAELRPDSGEVHFARSILQYWVYRDYRSALRDLEVASNALPNDAEIRMFVGLVHRRQGDWEASTRILEEARSMDPRNDFILFELTRTNYLATKRYRDAAEACDSVLVRKPDSFVFALNRAKIDVAGFADLRRLQLLLSSPAAAAAEQDVLTYERVQLALLERDPYAAQQALESHELPEFDWAGYMMPTDLYRGLVASGFGNDKEAQRHFEAAYQLLVQTVATRPTDAKAYIVQAEIAARIPARRAEAVQIGERASAMRPIVLDAVDGVNITTRLAGVYAQVGELHRSLDLLERVAAVPQGPSYGTLALEETWDPLRKEPRFMQLLTRLAPKPSNPH
jgi:serine/threonine protein kinase